MGGEDIAVENELSFLKDKFEVETLFFENNITNLLSEIKSFVLNKNSKSVKKLKKKIDEFEPNVVYVHNTWFKASVGIFKLLEKQNIQTLVKIHNFRYFCTKNFLAKNHFEDRIFCKACGLDRKSMGVFNKYFQDSYLKSLISIRYGKKYFKLLKNSNLKILVLTDFHKKYLEKLGVDGSKLFVFRNYLNVNKSNQPTNNENYIIYAGRISEEKGVEDLISTFISCNFDDIELKIVGNGPLLSNLKNKYNNSNIKFLGEKTNKEVLTLISQSKAVVTATKLYEGQPMLLCEASSMGIPSIFPRTGGVSEYFPKDYKLSFNQFDYGDLKKKLELIKKQELILETGKENFDFISNYLNKQKLLDQFQRVSDEGE